MAAEISNSALSILAATDLIKLESFCTVKLFRRLSLSVQNSKSNQVAPNRGTFHSQSRQCYVMRNFGTYFTGTYMFLLVPRKSACCTIALGIKIPVLEIQSRCEVWTLWLRLFLR